VRHLTQSTLVALLLAAGCGGPKQYVHPGADLGAIRSVAVLPFESVVTDKLAAERVQKIFYTELLNTGVFDVVEPGQVLQALRREKMEPGAMTVDDFKRLGQALKVQGVFTGAVLEYDEGKSATVPAPRVSIQFRLVDTQTGTTLWSASEARGGATLTGRLFGIGGSPASGVAEGVVRDELAGLLR
jgi:TolB-like protein